MSTREVERQLNRVARGGALGMIGAVVSGAAGFGMVVAVARGYSTSEAGLFFTATAVFLVLVAVATLGTESGFARFLMRYEAQGRSHAVRRAVEAGSLPALGVSLLLAGLGGAFAGLVADALGLGSTGTDLLVVLFLALPFAVCADLALSVLRAFSRIRSTVVIDRILRSGLQLVAVLVVVAVDGSLVLLTVCWAATYVVAAVLSVPLAVSFLARRHSVRTVETSTTPAHDGPVTAEFWAFTAYRGVARVAQIAIQKADIVIVAAVISPSAAALYTVATRFVTVGQVVTQALQQVMQPRFTAILLRKDQALLHDVHRTVTAWNILTVWPVYATVAAAPAAYLAMFGSGYTARDTWQIVVVMGVAMLFAVATGPIDTLLLMSGRSRISLANAVSALAVDIALCLALLPVIGVVGAAIAWACAVGLRCTLAVLQVRSDLGVPFGGTEPAIAAAVSIGCFALPSLAWTALGADGLGLWAALFGLGLAVYAVVLWRLRRVLRVDVLISAVFRSSGAMSGGRRVSSTLRKRLPGPVVTALRSLATGWGMLTARFRMEPTFLVAGAQRSGTTTLFRLLADHPNLVRPTLDKGTGYFDDNHYRGRRWYRAHFPIRALARWRTRGPVQTFECSGYYMFHPLAPGRIAAELPDARVVVMLRNPVDRAVSAYGHERRRGFESAGFVDALAREQERLADEVDRLSRDEHYRSFAHRHHAYLRRGEYAGQVAALIEAVGRDRVYVMDADAFFADPESEFVALQRWLGLPVWSPEHVDKWNAGSPEPMPAQWRARLEEYFAPHDRRLEALLGRPLHWRRTRTEAK
jgi:O-antigen/teichoic acid export membrane protein